MLELVWLVLLGLGTGTFGILVGAGGGVILAPMLLIFSDMSPEVVAGTSLALVAINSFSGSVVYQRLRLVDRRSGLLFAAAAIPGSLIAPFIVEVVAGGIFRALFGLLLIGLAVHLLVRTRIHVRTGAGLVLGALAARIGAHSMNRANNPARSGSLTSATATSRQIRTSSGEVYKYKFNEALATGFNVILGFVSAFFGTGGGFLLTPVLVTAFRFPVRVAVATSVFALSIYTAVGATVHASLGHVDWYPTFVWAGVGLIIGGRIGARLGGTIRSVWIIRLLVVLLLGIGIRLMMDSLVLGNPGPVFHIDELAAATPDGTPARVEREFKLLLDVPPDSDYLSDEGLELLGEAIYEALQQEVASLEWLVPEVVGQPYNVAMAPMSFVTRDFYLDTHDSVTLDYAISFRLRYRFESVQQLYEHEAAPLDSQYYPYRSEVQVKTDRQELGGGFSMANEARFEFRVESEPFSPDNLPPSPPWPPEEYLPIAQTGRYQDMVTTPGQLLAQYLKEKGISGEVYFDVALVLVSSRTRLHLNVMTRYGTGPNPDQAFIISIDRFDVFDGQPYLEFLARSSGWQTLRPPVLGTLYEIEIEFERNVSTKIDELIESGDDQRAQEDRNAFLQDQETLRLVVTRSLQNLGIDVIGVSASKYQRACQLLEH